MVSIENLFDGKRIVMGEGENILTFSEKSKELAPVIEPRATQMICPGDGVYQPLSYNEEEEYLTIQTVKGKTGKLSVSSLDVDKDELKAFLNEQINSGAPIMRIDGETFFLSKESLFTLKVRVGFSEETIEKVCPERNAFIQRLMMDEKEEWKFSVKRIGKVAKVFAFHSKEYLPIGDEKIVETLDAISKDLGPYELQSYEISQNMTTVYATFPDKAKEIADTYGFTDFVPGIRLQNSQTGYSSFVAQAVWLRPTGTYLGDKEIATRHRGNKVRLEPFFEKVTEELFKEFTALPEALVTLADITVSTDSSEAGNIEDFLKRLFKTSKVATTIGKQTEMKLRELLLTEFDPTLPITAYDVVTRVFDAPERIGGLPSSLKKPFANLCGEMPYKAVKLLSGKKMGSEAPDIYLIA